MTNHLAANFQIAELIEAIYATIDAPERWPAVLGSIGDAIHARNTLLLLSEPAPDQQGALLCPQTPPELLSAFLEHYAAVNVLADPCDRLFPDTTVRYSHLAVPDARFEQSEFYTDFFAPFDLYYSIGLKLPLSSGGLAYLSAQRSRQRDSFTEDDGRVYQLLLPHLRRALLLQARLGRQSNALECSESALQHFGKAVLGIDADGHLRYQNHGAEHLLRQTDVLFVRHGRLQARDPRGNARLQACLQTALHFDPHRLATETATVSLPRRAPAGPLHLIILPRGTPLPGVGGDLRGAANSLAALILLYDPAQAEPSRGVILKGLFALTATELRTADLLLLGLETKEVAARLQITPDAARFHIKSILRKTGTRRQSELMKLMLQLPDTSPQA